MENEFLHAEPSKVVEDKDHSRVRLLQIFGLAAILTGVLTILGSTLETAGAFQGATQ